MKLSVMLLASCKNCCSWVLCAYANQKICAHGAIGTWLACASTDSLTLDYVASGSTGQAVKDRIPVGPPKKEITKTDTPRGIGFGYSWWTN